MKTQELMEKYNNKQVVVKTPNGEVVGTLELGSFSTVRDESLWTVKKLKPPHLRKRGEYIHYRTILKNDQILDCRPEPKFAVEILEES